MRKPLLYLLLLVAGLSAMPATAQRSPLRFGVKAGAGLYQLNMENGNNFLSESNPFRPGFYGGALLEISGPAGSKLKGQVEALFQQHFFKNQGQVNGVFRETDTRLSQISVPLMVRYFPIPALSFNLGGSVNFNLMGRGEHAYPPHTTGRPVDFNLKEEDDLQPFQLGILVGASYYIYKGFFVDGRYNYHFGQITKSEPKQWIHGFQLGIGYKFGSPN